MPSASSLFLLPFCFRNLLLEIFSELDQNLWGLFLRQDEDGVRRAASEATHRVEAPPAAALGGPVGGTRPCPWGASSASSDAYKITIDLKTSRRPLFSRNSTPTRHVAPSLRKARTHREICYSLDRVWIAIHK